MLVAFCDIDVKLCSMLLAQQLVMVVGSIQQCHHCFEYLLSQGSHFVQRAVEKVMLAIADCLAFPGTGGCVKMEHVQQTELVQVADWQ